MSLNRHQIAYLHHVVDALGRIHSPGHNLFTDSVVVQRNIELLDNPEYRKGFETAANDAIEYLTFFLTDPDNKALDRSTDSKWKSWKKTEQEAAK